MSQIFRKPQHWSGSTINDIRDRMDQFNNMPDEKRAVLLCGEFKPDERLNALIIRLGEYYESTPSEMSNNVALTYWKEFKCWANERGCTMQEINHVKRHYRFK